MKKIRIDLLKEFENHPFKVIDDEELMKLTWSIKFHGVLSPIIVRPIENSDEFEIISGHRRVAAAKKAALTEIPAVIKELDHDEAVIAVVDSNLHRENILPSEKAFAYKMKMDALRQQGRRTDLETGITSRQDDEKLYAAFVAGKDFDDSERTVQRYIRLTYLIPELLQKVDEGVIAMSPAVELSFLTDDEQRTVLQAMEDYECTPSHAQTIRMKKLSKESVLTEEKIYDIMSEEKPNQKDKLKLDMDNLQKYFPKSYTPAAMERKIIELLEKWNRQMREKEER